MVTIICGKKSREIIQVGEGKKTQELKVLKDAPLFLVNISLFSLNVLRGKNFSRCRGFSSSRWKIFYHE